MFAKYIHVLILHSNELFAQELPGVLPSQTLLSEDSITKERCEDTVAIPKPIVWKGIDVSVGCMSRQSIAKPYLQSLYIEELPNFWDQERGTHAVQPTGIGRGCFEVRSRPRLSRGTLADVALNLNATAF